MCLNWEDLTIRVLATIEAPPPPQVCEGRLLEIRAQRRRFLSNLGLFLELLLATNKYEVIPSEDII